MNQKTSGLFAFRIRVFGGADAKALIMRGILFPGCPAGVIRFL